MLKRLILLGIIILFAFLNLNLVKSDSSQNNTMIVQANIIGFRNNISYEGVGIQVPSFINLGNITVDNPVSDEFKLNINNTGTVDITVTPDLADPDESIFSFLYFRTHKTSNKEAVPFDRIGEYSLNISKPSTGSTVRKAYCYMILNLTDFTGPIRKDLVGYQSEVIFWAMPSENS
jgi:hypothetical protein